MNTTDVAVGTALFWRLLYFTGFTKQHVLANVKILYWYRKSTASVFSGTFNLLVCDGLTESLSSIFWGLQLDTVTVLMNVNLQEIKSDIQRIQQIDSTSYNDPDTLDFVKAIAEKYTADWRQEELAFKYNFRVRLRPRPDLVPNKRNAVQTPRHQVWTRPKWTRSLGVCASKISVCVSQDTGYMSKLKL